MALAASRLRYPGLYHRRRVPGHRERRDPLSRADEGHHASTGSHRPQDGSRQQRQRSIPAATWSSPGGKWSLFLALSAILNPGDEVLLSGAGVGLPPANDRAWWHAGGRYIAGRRQLSHHRRPPTGKITPHTRQLMVNTPNNPTGRVLTRGTGYRRRRSPGIRPLRDLRRDLRSIIYDGREHLSRQPSRAWPSTLTINGLSKSHAMTGWRLGWLVG